MSDRKNTYAASTLDGSVYSQGIKVSYPGWLDMGSEEWKNTPDKVKAAAYQAAKVCGWKDEGIKQVMLTEFSPRVDEFQAEVTLDFLKDLEKTYPLEIEEQK